MSIEIKEVSQAEENAFIQLPYAIYKNNPDFIPHIESDIAATFDPSKNNYFEEGQIKRWLAYQNNQCVGRIAAGFKPNEEDGRIGFFECIDDQSVCDQLFTVAEKWLKSAGKQRVQAPVNFGSRDSFWGLMITGFKRPSYRESFNPRYYQTLIENQGYVEDFKQTTSEIDPKIFNHERFSKLAGRVLQNDAYEFKHLDYSKIDQFADDFVYIYNKAWENHDFFKPLKKEALLLEMKKMKPIAPEKYNWFVYANGEPAGFYINVLDVNQAFKHVNGKLNLIGKLKFLWYRKRIDRIRGIVFGVIPAYHNKGLETGMIMNFYDSIINQTQLKSAELSWIGDFNPKMQSLFNSLGAVTSKEHMTFAKQI